MLMGLVKKPFDNDMDMDRPLLLLFFVAETKVVHKG
jgi:hypothetical protein